MIKKSLACGLVLLCGCTSETATSDSENTVAGSAGQGGSGTAVGASGASGSSAGANTAGTGSGGMLGNAGSPGSSSGAGGASTGGVAGAAGAGGNATAGSGGGGGAAGSVGAAGAAGAAGAGNGPVASMGCGTQTAQATEEYVRFTWDQQGTEREFFIRLPANYAPDQPYRTAFLWTGCGGGGEDGIPLFNAEGAELIAIGPTPPGDCFESSVDSIDVEFFDYMLQFVKTNYCVDEARVFTAGHSSGSWMSNVLGCQRSDVLRGQGNIAGGLPGNATGDNCLTQGIAGMLIHDENDDQNGIQGGMNARDRLLALNGCGTETLPVEPAPCVEYQGCTAGFPVVWCQTQAQGHSRQDEISIPGMWAFFEQF